MATTIAPSPVKTPDLTSAEFAAATLAGLSLEYGVTPDLIRPWASRLASECPAWAAGNETAIVAAYFDLKRGAS